MLIITPGTPSWMFFLRHRSHILDCTRFNSSLCIPKEAPAFPQPWSTIHTPPLWLAEWEFLLFSDVQFWHTLLCKYVKSLKEKCLADADKCQWRSKSTYSVCLHSILEMWRVARVCRATCLKTLTIINCIDFHSRAALRNRAGKFFSSLIPHFKGNFCCTQIIFKF